jgi:hypothetical protein
VNAAVKSICDIMRRSNCAGALQYVPELTWILFLRILDEREQREAEDAEAIGAEFTPSLESPYRWRDWADPEGPKRRALGEATRGQGPRGGRGGGGAAGAEEPGQGAALTDAPPRSRPDRPRGRRSASGSAGDGRRDG